MKIIKYTYLLIVAGALSTPYLQSAGAVLDFYQTFGTQYVNKTLLTQRADALTKEMQETAQALTTKATVENLQAAFLVALQHDALLSHEAATVKNLRGLYLLTTQPIVPSKLKSITSRAQSVSFKTLVADLLATTTKIDAKRNLLVMNLIINPDKPVHISEKPQLTRAEAELINAVRYIINPRQAYERAIVTYKPNFDDMTQSLVLKPVHPLSFNSHCAALATFGGESEYKTPFIKQLAAAACTGMFCAHNHPKAYAKAHNVNVTGNAATYLSQGNMADPHSAFFACAPFRAER